MENYNEIKKLAKDIRISMLKMLLNLGFGHFGGSLSVVETLAVLYGAVMKIDPKNPWLFLWIKTLIFSTNDRQFFIIVISFR